MSGAQLTLPRGRVRDLFAGVADQLAVMLRLRDPLLPPKRLRFVGDSDFRATGDEFLRYFTDLGRLDRSGSVLDVGCGIGRMALPLTGYLSASGSYHGIDIVGEGIAWCQKQVTPRYPNFRFTRADVYNQFYNPAGTYRDAEYRFPFADSRFDLVTLTSVFTHMLPEGLGNYLSQISRVLRPGGRCLITYFLLNDESRSLVEAGRSSLDFRHPFGGCRVVKPDVPEWAIAYDEAVVRALYRERGLRLVGPVRYGSWCGRHTYMSYQDIIVAEKA